jgi:MFS family permease
LKDEADSRILSALWAVFDLDARSSEIPPLHADIPPSSDDAAVPKDPSYRWYRELNRYHWFVLIVAALGWLFDCLDQQLFILARPAAMNDLLKHITDAKELQLAAARYGDIATSVFIAGWATGGLVFGMLGDRIGRAKTMVITILMYSAFTGLSALSVSVYDFSFYRFLTGLGVGGEFAVGVSLVAEVMPTRARTYALSLLQALSAFGNISAALINLGLGIAEGEGLVTSPWRIMFCIGALPAFLSLIIRRRLKEPEAWQKSHDASKVAGAPAQVGTYRELFSHPLWRKHALLGLVLACSGVIGLWAVGFYTPDLIRQVQTRPVTDQIYKDATDAAKVAGDEKRATDLAAVKKAIDENRIGELTPELVAVKSSVDGQIKGRLTYFQSFTSIAINIGAFCGMFGFGVLSQRIGRKNTFVIALLASFFSTAAVFWFLTDLWQIFVLVPIMGFCQLSLFGGYAVYFPELFPTRLRSTGVSFCYNVGRFVAALGPLVKIYLNNVFKDFPEPLRYAGVTMCLVFLVGLIVLPFLPETLGKELPE